MELQRAKGNKKFFVSVLYGYRDIGGNYTDNNVAMMIIMIVTWKAKGGWSWLDWMLLSSRIVIMMMIVEFFRGKKYSLRAHPRVVNDDLVYGISIFIQVPSGKKNTEDKENNFVWDRTNGGDVRDRLLRKKTDCISAKKLLIWKLNIRNV